MCGRFVAASPPSVVAETFDVKDVVETDLPPRWNVAPTMDALVVSVSAEVDRRLTPLRWGLVPWWADSPAIGSRFINARAEGIETARAYRSALASRRCLVPADGFYEWEVTGPSQPSLPVRGARAARRGRATRSSRRQPYFVRNADGSQMAFAGLWERWRDAEGVWLRSFTIVTTGANSKLGPIHDRMPVILPRDSWAAWLDHEGTGVEAARALLVPAPSESVDAYAVSDLVNSPRNEGPELVERAATGPS